jgi:hypothetical protein
MDEQELSVREAAAWGELEDAVGAIAAEQRETLALNEDGWTTKDLLWHVAHWWIHLTELLHECSAGRAGQERRDHPFDSDPQDEGPQRRRDATGRNRQGTRLRYQSHHHGRADFRDFRTRSKEIIGVDP